jgi:hypothetical protein
MGAIVVEESGTANLASGVPAAKATTIEEEVKIEEIVRPEEETVAS